MCRCEETEDLVVELRMFKSMQRGRCEATVTCSREVETEFLATEMYSMSFVDANSQMLCVQQFRVNGPKCFVQS
jgi:hypothetical protein